MNIKDLINISFDKNAFFCFLRSNSLIKSIMKCDFCEGQLHLIKYKRNIDGEAFVCQNTFCIYYKKYISIRKGSFLKNIK